MLDERSFASQSFDPRSWFDSIPPDEEDQRPYPGAAAPIGSTDGLIRIRRKRRRREVDLLLLGV
jgi:hypothetical protein